MESVHGVDVSWLHHPNKEHHHRSHAPTSPGLPQDTKPPTSSHGGLPPHSPSAVASLDETLASATPAGPETPQPKDSAKASATPAVTPSPTDTKQSPKRPTLSGSRSEDKHSNGGNRPPRRNSWMSNISSKFSSQTQNPPSPTITQTSKPQPNGTSTTTPQAVPRDQNAKAPSSPEKARVEAEELTPYVPQKPKESTSSFFSSITRRLSSSSQTGSLGRIAETGGVCPRRVMNVDPNRERCLVPELNSAKLRRVSFSVDVEIAAGPRYKDDEDMSTDKQKKKVDKRTKERAEGEALKHPQTAADLKENDKVGADEAIAKSEDVKIDLKEESTPAVETKDTANNKKEKKKRSEEERKERKEKKRRRAEENGTIPVELTREDDSSPSLTSSPPASGAVTPKTSQDRPTTDPVRIYRRCCQLRESPILKRITEQLMSPTCTMPGEPGTVTSLNLTGSRMQLADVVTLGDWLAIVPVKRLLLEDSDLTDEGVRVILAGLLAAKKPKPTRIRHAAVEPSKEERSGIVEKVVLKNNPRITRTGWKHIALFLYMCRSIKAMDVSMIHFPDTIPSSAQGTPLKGTINAYPGSSPQVDAAETLCKALSERLGGSKLEELTMSECGLKAEQIRKIVDGVVMSGVARLGLAGNRIDDEGFEHVLNYVRSGVCDALDIGSNSMHGRLGKLAKALTYRPDNTFWGLSLAYCDLDAETLKPLFPALVALPNFRFIDLSHNRHLFESDAGGGIHMLRKYIPQLRLLKRLHLTDVGLNTKQAIALAEILPEGAALAHLNILENKEITSLAAATDEQSQEEACALYASLMAAVRVSKTIICIDVDVPKPENSEVVKALAKQVVAYCLRNMERMSLADAGASAAAELARPHEPKDGDDITVPEVLLHLVGHVDGYAEDHDNDDPAPDDDYIVGGTGVVKALQYVLNEQAQEFRRGSTSGSGVTTPKDLEDEAGKENERKGKAKEMSKNLLGSARKIRARLQPALVKEAAVGDEMGYRRLIFLDQTLQGMIQRFENEYPETRIATPAPQQQTSVTSAVDAAEPTALPLSPDLGNSVATLRTEVSGVSLDSDEEDNQVHRRPSRHNSDVSLASRALSLEEGRIHRLGQGLRRDILSTASTPITPPATDKDNAAASSSTTTTTGGPAAPSPQDSHLAELGKKVENLSGSELREIVEKEGWTGVLAKIGANMEELRQLQENDPVGWEQFKESQMKARANADASGNGSAIE